VNEAHQPALDIINRSIDEAAARGVRLRQRATLGAKCCCPLGAVALSLGLATRWSKLSKGRRADVEQKTMAALGLTAEFAASDFARGFDGKIGTHNKTEAWALGRRVGIERGLIQVAA
jgi:hypothetical protein